MFYKFAGTLVLLFLCISCATSPQNILPSTLNGNGILVVPQTATAEHTELAFDYSYCYVLSCQPKTDLKLEIIPDSSKDFITINNFPPGEYTIDGYTWEGIREALPGSGQFNTIKPISFEIQPNMMTILNNKFETKVKSTPAGGSRTYFKIMYLSESERQNVLRGLEKAENYKLWGVVQGRTVLRQAENKDFGVIVTANTDRVSQSDIKRVKWEAEYANIAISSILGIERKKTIEVRIVDEGIVNVSGGTIFLPAGHVTNNNACIVMAITNILVKSGGNRFFSAGLGVYFQDRFGEDNGFPNFSGEPLNVLVRNYKDKLMPITELDNNNMIFRQVGTERRKIAFIEAGSFFDFLVEMYGEQKLRELHDTGIVNYDRVYGKNLNELEEEWKEFVF